MKLTPWQTFFKNLVLLPISIYVWLKSDKKHSFTRVDFISIAVALLLPLSVNFFISAAFVRFGL